MEDLQVINTIENRIFTMRGVKVMIDRDLAELYGVKTMVLNQAVKRNIKRFPDNFMFKLNDDEMKELITNCDRLKNLKHSSTQPFAFTEQGVAMLSSVLHSEKAIQINIQIMNTFVRMRQYAAAQASKSSEIAELKKILMLYMKSTDSRLDEHEEAISHIIGALNNLIETPCETKPIGFRIE